MGQDQLQKGRGSHVGIPSADFRNQTDHFYWDFFIYSLVNWIRLINSKTQPEAGGGEHGVALEKSRKPQKSPAVAQLCRFSCNKVTSGSTAEENKKKISCFLPIRDVMEWRYENAIYRDTHFKML